MDTNSQINYFLIIETYKDMGKQNFYYLCPTDNYREKISLNAFFNSKNNTNKRVFQLIFPDEICFYDVKSISYTFKNIDEFYCFVGYDRKRKKYQDKDNYLPISLILLLFCIFLSVFI